MRTLINVLFLYVVNLGDVTAKSLNILMYSPATGLSHVNFMGSLADIVVDAGHIVHILMPEMIPGVATNGTQKAQKIIRKPPSFFESPLPLMGLFSDPFSKEVSLFSLEQFNIILNCSLLFCEDMITSKWLLSELRTVSYDVAITEHYDYCLVGLFHMLGIKSIVFVSAVPITDQISYAFGLPTPLAYTTNVFATAVSAPKLSYWERISNLFAYIISRSFMIPTQMQRQKELFSKYVDKNFPDLEELLRAVPVVFVNSHPILEIPRPISANIFYLGGIGIRQALKLDSTEVFKKMEKVVQSSRKGAVLFSLGSITNTTAIPISLRKDILNAFRRFSDYNFIMKTSVSDEDKALFAAYDNVHTYAWVDQITLLNHPSVVGFITHAGHNSFMEAAYAGKPMVCIPLFADQEYNTAMALNKGVAVYLDRKKLNIETLSDALEKILYDSRYMKAAQRLKQKLERYPHSPKEMFLKWVEYVAEYPEADMTLEGGRIGFFKYFLLDILLPAFIVIIITLLFVSLLLKLTIRKLQNLLKQKVE